MTPRELQRRIGLVIRRHREKLKYSQEDFAGAADIHRTYYGNIERGTQNFSVSYLLKISLILNVPLSTLPDSTTRTARPTARGTRSASLTAFAASFLAASVKAGPVSAARPRRRRPSGTAPWP